MPAIQWDEVTERKYEVGLDRGVLYLPDGSAVPWNGLTSVIEHFDKEPSPVYFDGMKISDLVSLGDFSATMRAVTYPEEFDALEGLGEVREGLFYGDQRPQTFGLCYRTQIADGVEGDVVGYKIHILYNVTALPSEKTYASESGDPSLTEFEWNLTAVPEEIPGFRPTSHIIINTKNIDPWLLEELEQMLYGTTVAEASLVPMQDLVTRINDWFRVKIVDNGDGTWTASSERDGFIFLEGGMTQYFEIVGINAIYLTDEMYQISDTTTVSDVPQIAVHDNGDGTFTATTDHPSLIVMLTSNTFKIYNAHVNWQGPDAWSISDTTAED